jgi:FkbM family methyltransferase
LILSRFRKTVDRFAPSLGRAYRSLRDATIWRKPIPTKYGFTLAGDPIWANNDWEVGEIKTFIEILETHDAVIDIGANVGFYTCLAASRGKQAIAFEPAARNLKFLYKNLSENQLTNVEVFPLGLAGQSGLGRIYGADSVASFVPRWAQAREAHYSVVPLSTLDNIASCRFKGKSLFIKMDVEGFELDVLAGATETLDLKPKPTWLVEVILSGYTVPGGINRRFSEVFEVFWKHGYHCRMPDSGRTSVGQDDVSRWVRNGFVDSGMRDFLFSGD